MVTAGAKDRERHTVGLSGGMTWATFPEQNSEKGYMPGGSQPVCLDPFGVADEICMSDVHIIIHNSSKVTIIR